MTRTHKWLAGIGVFALLSAGVAWSQVPATFNLTGNEIVRAALPGGGSDIAVPLYVLRSGNNHQLIAAGTTVTTQVNPQVKAVLATGAITTWNINLPTAPFLGENVLINCPGGTVGTISVTATLPAGVAIVGTAYTGCTSGGTGQYAAVWEYSVSANTWYRIL